MNYKPLLISLLVFTIFVLPSLALAQKATYTPLVGIPGLGNGEQDFGKYINALYALSISIAALMAVIKIIIAGVKYMLSDVVTSKSEAISDIRGSVIGLIVVISAVLILTVINPQLKTTEIFLDPATVVPQTAVTAVTGTVQSKTGYKYIIAGTVPNFKTDCTARGGAHQLAGLDGKSIEVCYDPLPGSYANLLNETFGGSDIDLETLKRRYQTAHYPALIANTDRLAQIAADNNGRVLVAVDYTAPYDWIDNSNRGSLQYTCNDLRRVSGAQVVQVGNETKGYLACIAKN